MAGIRVDQRGHGDSDRSVIAAYQYPDFSADVLAFHEAVKAPPLVIGASMGGIAALVAQGHPIHSGLATNRQRFFPK
jgi:pimeloyl-ACP methyl ester carboxylesterase